VEEIQATEEKESEEEYKEDDHNLVAQMLESYSDSKSPSCYLGSS